LTRRCTRRRRWRAALSRRTRGPRWLPARWLTPRTVLGAVGGGQRPCVAGRSRWRPVSRRRLTETATGSFQIEERRRRRVGLTTRRAGLGTRRRRRPSAGRRCRALGVFLAGWARATIWRDEVDRLARGHRRLGGRGRFGLRCRRLVVGFLGARPAELFPQCVVAVGHCTISFSVRRRGCRPLSSINYTGSALSHTATRVRRDRPANTLRGLR
jgi:hypothetical protein